MAKPIFDFVSPECVGRIRVVEEIAHAIAHKRAPPSDVLKASRLTKTCLQLCAKWTDADDNGHDTDDEIDVEGMAVW